MDEINFIFQRIEKIFENDASGHDYWHTFRVYKNALKIAENEKCDKRIVAISALLHDVDDVKLFHTENFYNARSILAELNISSEMTNKIINIIKQISFKGVDSVSPDTIEGKIVQDADRLDALGAIGIARAFAYGGNKGRCMYHPGIKPLENISEATYHNNESTTINHFYEKLFLLKDFIVRRHIVGGANRTLISALLPPRLRSRVGNRKLSAGQPHAVAALFEKQKSCF